MKSEYSPPKTAWRSTKAVERAYNHLDDDTKYEIDKIKRCFISKVKKLGEKGAIELIGKVGMKLAQEKK